VRMSLMHDNRNLIVRHQRISPMKSLILLPFLLAVTFANPALAVIVAGASGGGNTTSHTTQAQFENIYSIPLPVYNNVISYAGASGIYLGYNATTHDVWVLTARHIGSDVTQGATVTIGGLTYNRQPEGSGGFGLLPGGDLRLVRYQRPDLAVPTLPAVNISTSIPTAGTALLMVGYGQNRTEIAATVASIPDATSVSVGTGYHWTGPNIKRWGTNQIEAEFYDGFESIGPISGPKGTFSMGTYNTVGYMTDFDQPASNQWLTSDEAQGSVGDSGGSAFYYSGSGWVLSGIFTAVAGFSGQAANTSAFGNVSLLTDVASYSTAINSALGGITLVPEPEISMLFLLASGALFTRRRRSTLV